MQQVYRRLLKWLTVAGKPVGGVRPRRIYEWLGRRAHTAPEYRWFRNRYGADLWLSPHLHIDRQILIFGCYDPELHAALETRVKPGMVCIDAGANLGEVALHLAARAGKDGLVLAFEPAPETYERMIKHAERNERRMRLVTYPQALSDEAGAATLHLPAEGCDNDGLASLAAGRAELKRRVEIQTTTVDDVVRLQALTRLDVIKADVQGAELKLLQGAREALKRFGPDLYLEISPEDLRANGAEPRDVAEFLLPLGYRFFTLKGGRPGREIPLPEFTPRFAATNVLCTRKVAR